MSIFVCDTHLEVFVSVCLTMRMFSEITTEVYFNADNIPVKQLMNTL